MKARLVTMVKQIANMKERNKVQTRITRVCYIGSWM